MWAPTTSGRRLALQSVHLKENRFMEMEGRGGGEMVTRPVTFMIERDEAGQATDGLGTGARRPVLSADDLLRPRPPRHPSHPWPRTYTAKAPGSGFPTRNSAGFLRRLLPPPEPTMQSSWSLQTNAERSRLSLSLRSLFAHPLHSHRKSRSIPLSKLLRMERRVCPHYATHRCWKQPMTLQPSLI